MFNWNLSFDTQGQLKAGLFISLVSVWLLVGVFSYLNYYTRRKYFSIWTVAWLFYSLYLTLSYSLFWFYGNFRDEPWWATMFKQWCIGVSAVFMLWGSLRFLGRRVRQLSLGLFLCFLFVWSFVANFPAGDPSLDKNDRLVLQMPIFILIGAASVVTVWGFFQYRRKRQYLGAGLLSFGFLFWGLFVAAYPFLERLSDYMSTGFFIASVLQMFIAVNMIILVLEQIRHLREKRTAQQLRSKEKEKVFLQNRIILTEERYRHLFEQSSEPIVITTRDDLRIVGLNEAACRILAMPQAEARELCLTHFLAAPVGDASIPPAGGLAWFESVCRGRFQQVRRKDGTLVNVEVAGSAIDFAGETAFQFYLREVTEISRVEQQLRRAEKLSALGQMISGVIHELNNPLSVSGALLELVLMDKELPKPARDRLKTAAAEHQRATRMMRNFLNLARDGGPEKERVSLNEVVRNVVELRRSEFMKASVELALELDPELPAILASLDQVQQVLIILINNALQAMEASTKSRTLRIVTRQEPGRLVALIEDSGPGVPSHLRSKIFEPFFTTKPAGVGTGLGLSVAHTYLMEHRGRIFCDASPLGGALFGIELPAVQGPVPRPAPQITRLKIAPDPDAAAVQLSRASDLKEATV